MYYYCYIFKLQLQQENDLAPLGVFIDHITNLLLPTKLLKGGPNNLYFDIPVFCIWQHLYQSSFDRKLVCSLKNLKMFKYTLKKRWDYNKPNTVRSTAYT